MRHVCDGGRAALRDQAGDGALSDVDSQHLQFAMDSRRAPERIGLSHSYDESPDLAAYARASRRGASGEFGPVLAEAAALPPQDGVGRHQDESFAPAGPHPGRRDPEPALAAEQLRPFTIFL